MRKQRWLRTLCATAIACWTLLPLASSAGPFCAHAFTARNLSYGSQGYDVDELQNRLRYIGFYKGKVDGVFGWKTYWAVRNFQYKFGLPVTGRVDMPTKLKLVRASAGWQYRPKRHPVGPGMTGNSPIPTVPGVSQSDIRLIQHVVYGEARGEPYTGEVAIAAVILNRMHDPRFPHTVPAIVYQPGAFTAVADGQVNLQPDQESLRATLDAIHGWDPSHGAVYYFNPATATSGWMWSRPQIVRIGKHIFCR